MTVAVGRSCSWDRHHRRHRRRRRRAGRVPCRRGRGCWSRQNCSRDWVQSPRSRDRRVQAAAGGRGRPLGSGARGTAHGRRAGSPGCRAGWGCPGPSGGRSQPDRLWTELRRRRVAPSRQGRAQYPEWQSGWRVGVAARGGEARSCSCCCCCWKGRASTYHHLAVNIT